MNFANPAALLLLLLLVPVAWLGWPRMRFRRGRAWASLALRIVIIAALAFALAGAQAVRAAEKLSVVFLVDASDSVDSAARGQADTYLREALAAMRPDDRAGIIVFGQNALVERPLSNTKEYVGLTSAPIRLNTNIAEAIRLALAMFPADSARRIVLLSDGVETLGSATQSADLAAAASIPIEVVPLNRQPGPEIEVSSVRAPSRVNAGEQFDLGVTIRSQTAGPAQITILASGATIVQRSAELQVGANEFVFTVSVPAQGFSDFRVRVDPLGKDTFYQNNELSAFTEITGPPKVLLVTQTPTEVAALTPALQQAGLSVDVIDPAALPGGVAGLAGYRSVILANVSATAISNQQMKIIQTYVRDLGGGLVAIGGPNSYGAGGYFQTPLEETLPVEMRLKDVKRIPKLTMAYVIDRSGSMEMIGPSGVTNLELAKEATRRSINFLYPQDRAGVLSFDSNPEWLVPIQSVTNQDAMRSLVGTLRPGGGTDILAAVKAIAAALPGDPSTLKHVILLTDGGAEPGDSVEIVRKLNQDYGITVTSIGIGRDVPTFMQDIATAGKGIFYNLTDVQNIPQVFAAETVLATRSYIVEQEFNARQVGSSSLLNGIVALPPLYGYIASTAKPTATVALTAPGYDDPLLASWQYGLGRAVAFTSDASGRWAKAWTSWDGFSRFWAQVVRSTMIEGVNTRLETRIEQRDGGQVLVVEARDEQGAYLNSLKLDASLVDSKLNAQGLTLQQVAPGRYEVPFTPQQEGAYFIRVAGGNAQVGASAAQTLGWVLSYSPEYQIRPADTTLLNTLARITGGRVLSEQPALAFEHNVPATAAPYALWPWLLLFAALLLPLDIAIRRLILTRSDWSRAQAWVRAKLPTRAVPVPVPTSERLSALLGAKERVAAPTQSTAPGIAPDARPTASLTNSNLPPPAITAAPPATNTAPAPGSLAARLLENKKKNNS